MKTLIKIHPWGFIKVSVLFRLFFSFSLGFAFVRLGNAATDPASDSESLAKFHSELAERRPALIEKISSGDPIRVKDAFDEVDAWTRDVVAARRADLLEIFVDTSHFAEAEERAVGFMKKSPANNYAIEHLQKLRVKSLLKQGKTKEALSSARTYYNVCRFSETKDAINLISLCLDAEHPLDKSFARRFKEQQVAGASSTRPAGDSDDVEASILSEIPLEEAAFQIADAEKVVPTGYLSCEAKGNLLLLAGHADEARECFEKAYDVADDKQITGAIENIARSIRAQSCKVGPANTFLIDLQKENQGAP